MLKIGGQICIKTLFSCLKSPVVDTIKKEALILLDAQQVRKTSFFSKCSKQQLWKGVLSVSNAGRRKGRGRRADNIHRKSVISDKVLGEGPLGVSWPGLNTPVMMGSTVTKIQLLPENKKQTFVQPTTKPKRFSKVHPLDRGWSGRSVAGKKLGPPKDFGNYNFKNFESVVLYYKSRSVMTSNFGRRRIFLSIIATGNGNGLLGVASSLKYDGKIALKVAQKRAAKKLLTIDLIEKHTVNHDFFSQYGKTKVFVSKMPEGFGLRCHRAIIAMCKLVGIENLHAKVEGPCNVPNLIKAFIVGLLRQKTYQQIADEKNLHVVEFKEESHNFPLVLASPKECLTLSAVRRNPVFFQEYIMGNRMTYKPEEKVPFYQKLPSWRTYLLRTLFCRNHDKVKIDLEVKYGACISHLTAIYPECTSPLKGAKKPKEENTAE